MNRQVLSYLKAIGQKGGKAGKGSPAKAASARKAALARWNKSRKVEDEKVR